MEIKYLTIALALASASTLFAQTEAPLRGSVNVDGRYLPDVIRQNKVNTLPRLYSFPLESSELNYEKTGVTTPFTPSFAQLPALAWQSSRELNDSKGYVNLQLGSWLNSSLSAGYQILDTKETHLGVWLQHNSTSLWKPEMSAETKDVTRHRYDDVFAFDFSHRFNDYGTLSSDFAYHLGYFNYYGFYGPNMVNHTDFKAPTQTLNDVNFNIGWLGSPQNSFNYHAKIGIRHFAYRALYAPIFANNHALGLEHTDGQHETDFNVNAGINYNVNDLSSFGIDANLDCIGYNETDWELFNVENYSNLTLSPHYRFTQGKLNVQIGAKIDMTFDAGTEMRPYDTFHFSPDVRVDFKSGPAGLYLHLGGGTQLNTLANQANTDYYGLPAILNSQPIFSPLDAKLGINFGPFYGISAGMAFAYKNMRHQPLNGLYTYYLNHGNESITGTSNTHYNLLDTYGLSMKGWSLQGNVHYRYGKKIDLGFDISYQPQDGSKGYYNGMDNARWTLDASLSVAPIEPLRITAHYGYRGVRKAYYRTITNYDEGIVINGQKGLYELKEMRLSDITNLSLRADWQLNKSISLNVQANNLLNNNVELMPELSSEGVTILGGVQFVF